MIKHKCILQSFLPNGTPGTPEPIGDTVLKSIINKPLLKGYSAGWTRTPWAVVLHFTAGFTSLQCYKVLEKRNLSVHYCIERDGVLYRHLSDNSRAWHSGFGRWCGKSNLNNHAFGIEIVNFGFGEGPFMGQSPHFVFRYKEEPEVMVGEREWYRDETYQTAAGDWITTRIITKQPMAKFPDHREDWENKYWAQYTPAQIDSVCWQVWNWVKEYKILPENIIGHEHVTPERKQDPGPAFPWRIVDDYILARALVAAPELIDFTYKPKLRIKAVQSHCSRLALDAGDIDGVWGPKTEKAINEALKKYSETYGFRELIVDPQNITAIASALKLVPGSDLEKI